MKWHKTKLILPTTETEIPFSRRFSHRLHRKLYFDNFWCSQSILEPLERLRSEDSPAASWLSILFSHIGSQVKRRQSQSYKFKEFAKITWSCLIRCVNMKWMRRVLLKIQSGHDSVHRRTDGRTDKVKPVYPPFNFVEAGGIKCHQKDDFRFNKPEHVLSVPTKIR